MNLINTTNYPDYFLRRMVSWISKKLEMPVRYLKSATFRNRYINQWGGAAGYRKFTAAIGTRQVYHRDTALRLERLVWVTAHELAHVDNKRIGDKTRARGGWGGSEKWTDKRAREIKDEFLADRINLVVAWRKVPEQRMCATPRKTIVEQREENAAKLLKKWEAKLKTAKTKVQKYKAKVKYYEMRRSIKKILDTPLGQRVDVPPHGKEILNLIGEKESHGTN